MLCVFESHRNYYSLLSLAGSEPWSLMVWDRRMLHLLAGLSRAIPCTPLIRTEWGGRCKGPTLGRISATLQWVGRCERGVTAPKRTPLPALLLHYLNFIVPGPVYSKRQYLSQYGSCYFREELNYVFLLQSICLDRVGTQYRLLNIDYGGHVEHMLLCRR